MEFSSLVLMEKDKNTNHLIKELGSYAVGEGAVYVTKLFYDGESVNLYFDTHRDVEEWEFTAIYDLFNEEAFTSEGLHIQAYDEEYNPTWIVKFSYEEEYEIMKNIINKTCNIIEGTMKKVFLEISEKKEQYL
jgi:hypothetical protein